MADILDQRDSVITWRWSSEAAQPVPSLLECFEAMEAAALAEQPGAAVVRIAPCARPYFEVTLVDDAGTPIAGAACTLLFAEGGGRSAATDQEGRAHFNDLAVDASRLHCMVYTTSGVDGRTVYEVEVHDPDSARTASERPGRLLTEIP